MKLVIGLAGKIGSGKSEIGNYLSKKYGASQHRFSQILMDILKRLHRPPEREALQKLGASLRSQLGPDVLVAAFKADLDEDQREMLVIDGIRYENEVELLRGFKNNILLFVSAPSEARYERVKKRGEKGEHNITFEEFKEAEERETERYLGVIAKKADYVLDNSGTKEELYKRVDAILKDHLFDEQILQSKNGL
ncbi:MAG: AAA family ATPase [Candidatus Hydrothermarchaeales archaeon]